MDDEQILERGGTEEDIREYAKANGADLTKDDVVNKTNVEGWEDLTEYIPSRKIEFGDGRVVKEFIISENELREMIALAEQRGAEKVIEELGLTYVDTDIYEKMVAWKDRTFLTNTNT